MAEQANTTAPDSPEQPHAQQQYWEKWMSLVRQAIARMGEATGGQDCSETLQQCGEAVAAAYPKADPTLLDRLIPQATTYLVFSEQALKIIQALYEERDWRVALQRSFATIRETFFQPFQGNDAAHAGLAAFWGLPLDSWQRIVSSFALGYTQQWQEQLQQGGKLWLDYQQANGEYRNLLHQIAQRSLDLLHQRLINRAEQGQPVKTLREFYNLWVDCSEQTYAQAIGSDTYSEINGRMINALMCFKRHCQHMIANNNLNNVNALKLSLLVQKGAPSRPLPTAQVKSPRPKGNQAVSPMIIKPDQAVQELLAFTQKVANGVNILGEIGEIDVGISPRDVVYQEDKLVVYRYRPLVSSPHPVPLLITYALVNRPYMMDLQRGRSMLQGLLEAGIDVYLIDWGYPDTADRYLTLEDYIDGYLCHCVDYIRAYHKLDQINLLGVCEGGVLSLCFSALYPDKVKNLVTMVTPVDFHTPDNRLTHLAKFIDIDLLVDTLGNIPGEMLNFLFLSLNPFRLTGQKYVDLVDILEDDQALRNFLRMEKWIFDSPAQTGEAFRQVAKDLFQENKLIKGKLRIGERRINLENITLPVLNVYATEDHIVPPAASKALRKYCASADYSELSFKGGHIGIYVSGRAQREVPPVIGAWLQKGR